MKTAARLRSATLLSLAGSALLLSGTSSAQQFPPDDELQRMVRFVAEDGGAPALVFGILEADGSTRFTGHGTVGRDGAPDEHTVFEIGSITKTFTATLLADMVLSGDVALDDPVARHLPAHVTVPSRDGREITLLDLATHTSGLPEMPDNLGPRNPWLLYPDYSVDDLYAFLASHELDAVPGSSYLYSNLNYGLLGHALAHTAGTSYATLMRDRVLDPLGMDMTGVAGAGRTAAALVDGHRRGSVAPHWVGTEALQGAGAMHSTAADMLKYVRAHVGEPVTRLEQAMRLAQQVRVPRGEVEGAGRGLAWNTAVLDDGASLVMHGGITAGFSARVAFVPEHDVGTILLANDVTFRFHHGGGATLLFPLPPEGRWAEAPVAPGALRGLEGRYVAARRGAYDVRLHDDGHLRLEPRGSEGSRLHATSDTTFYLLGTRLALTFQRGDDGTMSVTAHRRESPDNVAWVAVQRQAGFGRHLPLLPSLAALLLLLAAAALARRMWTRPRPAGEGMRTS